MKKKSKKCLLSPIISSSFWQRNGAEEPLFVDEENMNDVFQQTSAYNEPKMMEPWKKHGPQT